jgi:carboxyl-terminal processing protease
MKIARYRNTFLASVIVSSILFTTVSAAADAKPSPTALVDDIFNLLQSNHVSGVNAEKLSDNAIKGMISGLDDPYTVYMTAKEWTGFQNLLNHNYVGIGVRLGKDDKGVFIAEVFKGSPAEAAGVMAGDYITAVAGKSIKGISGDDLINQIMGDENTKVLITFARDNQPIDLTITRKQINLPVVTSKHFEDGTGYIRLSSFSSDADELFAAKLQELKQAGIHSLIIDLRDNGGGLLDSAANIAKLFIKDGVLIHTSDRNHVDAPITLTGGASVSFPVYVLVNENSASASEVLTGALQDYKLATVIGTKSYGKGSVQSIFPLSNGGVLKVTIEEYLTPNHRKVNKVGITPDVEAISDVPQLLTALHAAGMQDVTLTQDRYSIMINQQPFSEDYFSIKTVNQKKYVPSRVLAAMINGSIGWNKDTQAVEITDHQQKGVFPISSAGILIENGTSYIDLDIFKLKFPQLESHIDQDVVTMHVKGNG